MGEDVVYQNKDVLSKLLAEKFKGKSLAVYGLKLPKIVGVLPTNLPDVQANELRIDNLFLLEDGTIAIIDYESKYKEKDKIKYLSYIIRVLERYKNEGYLNIKLRMIVIYTADVKRKQVKTVYNAGTLHFEIEAAFLSELNSKKIARRLTKKIKNGEILTDEELMELIVLPLTYRKKEEKQSAIKKAVQLARKVKDEDKKIFLLSGILVFTDKIIDEYTSNQVKEWIRMTKVERLFLEEKKEAVEKSKIYVLIEKTCCKLKKGKTPMIIADELEEELSLIEKICDAASQCVPEYETEKIYELLKENMAVA